MIKCDLSIQCCLEPVHGCRAYLVRYFVSLYIIVIELKVYHQSSKYSPINNHIVSAFSGVIHVKFLRQHFRRTELW